MLNSQETLVLIERMLDKYDVMNDGSISTFLTNEERSLFNNLVENYKVSNDLKLTLILNLSYGFKRYY